MCFPIISKEFKQQAAAIMRKCFIPFQKINATAEKIFNNLLSTPGKPIDLTIPSSAKLIFEDSPLISTISAVLNDQNYVELSKTENLTNLSSSTHDTLENYDYSTSDEINTASPQDLPVTFEEPVNSLLNPLENANESLHQYSLRVQEIKDYHDKIINQHLKNLLAFS
jgi:hypothetical protein